MKQKKQIIFLIVVATIAAGIWSWEYLPGDRTVRSVASLQRYQPIYVPDAEIHPRPHHDVEYKNEGVVLTSYEKPRAQPEPIVHSPAEPEGGTISEFSPPQFPLKFFGYGTIPTGSLRRAFLADGEEVYIVSEGDTLMGRYRILKINNASLEFEEISSGRRGQKAIEDQGPNA